MSFRTPIYVAALTLLIGCGDTEEIAALQSEISALQTQLEDLQSTQAETNTALQAEIDAINGAVDLTELAASVEVHSGRLDALESDVTVIEEDYLVAASLDGYATAAWVSGQGFGYAADITANANSITANTDSITSNSTNIGSNATAITANTSSNSIHDAALAIQGANISSNTASIGTNVTAITSNAAEIATNATDIDSLDDGVITISTTWTVGPSASADYPTLASALEAARDHTIRGNALLTLQLEAGTHTTGTTALLNHPQGNRLRILGDSTNPSNVIYQYSGSDNAFELGSGNSFHSLYGLTIEAASTLTQTAISIVDGSSINIGYMILDGFGYYGLSIRRNSNVRIYGGLTSQYHGSYGIDVRDESYLYGSNVIVKDNASYGIAVNYGSSVYLPNSSVFDNGDSGAISQYGSQLTMSNSHSLNNNDYGFAALYNSFIYADNSWAADNGYSGFYANDASIRARFSAVNNNGTYGYQVGQNAWIDANYYSATGNLTGDFNVTERTSTSSPAVNVNIYR